MRSVFNLLVTALVALVRVQVEAADVIDLGLSTTTIPPPEGGVSVIGLHTSLISGGDVRVLGSTVTSLNPYVLERCSWMVADTFFRCVWMCRPAATQTQCFEVGTASVEV